MFNNDFFALWDRDFPGSCGFRYLSALAAQAQDKIHELEDDKRAEWDAIDADIGRLDDAAFKRFGGFDWPDDVKAQYDELDAQYYEAQDVYYSTSEVAGLFDDLVPALREVTGILERLERLRYKG